MVDVTVSKTALDALHAKLSFSSVGYEPTITPRDPRTPSNEACQLFYVTLLQLMAQALDADDADNTHTVHPTLHRAPRIKRQTPLIHAGYATRVAIITNTIKRFVLKQQRCFNIILLGCGLDVLGLWVHSLPQSQGIFTYEVDGFDNASEKCRALQRFSNHLKSTNDKIWNMTERTEEHRSAPSILFQGYISVDTSSSVKTCLDTEQPRNNFTLFHSDLRDISSLHQGFHHAGLDTSLPTLVITELVLAYLGQQENINQLLQYTSQHLCTCEDSLLLSYEPMGPIHLDASSHTGTKIVSVLDGFATDYFQRFSDKLGKKHGHVQSHRFQCIGPNPTFICNRVRLCGFDGPVDCCSAGRAVSSLHWTLRSHDIFDEYTALLMHLACYVVLTACSSSSRMNISNFAHVCPWSIPDRAFKGMGLHRTKQFEFKTRTSCNTPFFDISVISAQDEEQVRIHFEHTYAHLLDTSPSIKKMVKKALKTDLSSGRSVQQLTNSSNNQTKQSKISDYYSNLDGAFWVATVTDISGHGENDADMSRRKVIGFIGLRRAGTVIANNRVTGLPRYEIMRLVVCSDWRNMGVGKALISTVQEFTRDRLDSVSNEPAIIMATTPAILEEANKLYSSIGFELISEVTQSDLLMNTYDLSVNYCVTR